MDTKLNLLRNSRQIGSLLVGEIVLLLFASIIIAIVLSQQALATQPDKQIGQSPSGVTALAQRPAGQIYTPGCLARVEWSRYQVAHGDSLQKIARRSMTHIDTLAKANCLVQPHQIWVGQELFVPSPPGVA